ncbi:ExeM/NucH family extracellular endonuclease [Salinibius halmophilus]|uniref:ExeM/NucH family extracellular endonuclease n=1 Tax=Salinibius halmophilus TaxID=1853216 RepID=UPI000E65FEF8|nr:ExeM/NucH family extracellular endonuclease [Salinibius halmophilus]
MNKYTLLGLALAVGSANADLLITEYLEGASFNKALELTNVSNQALDLGQYEVKVYFNGNTSAGKRAQLSGNLAAGESYVLVDAKAASELLAIADQEIPTGTWNGDDAIVVYRNGEIVDSLGQVGFDPGSRYGSGAITTRDNVLRRTSTTADTNINDAFDPAEQYAAFDKNDFSDLGQFAGSGDGPGDNDSDNDQLSCTSDALAPHAVQGNAAASPLTGEEVTVAGVVSNVLPGLSGYTIASLEEDTDPSTSEGLFVYDSSNVSIGDVVYLNGVVKEFYNETQLSNISASVNCGTAPVTPTLVSMPVANWEVLEGMLITFADTLVVNDNYNLARFGEMVLATERQFIPTQIANPGSEANAVEAANLANRVLLDDGSTKQNPELVPYPAPRLAANNPVRVGDQVTELVATVGYGFNNYRLQPAQPPVFVSTERPASPDVERGNLTVASFNVLNYFNGDGLGAGFPTPRGASTEEELVRQQAKLVNAIAELNADVIGLMEIENDGFGPNSAIAQLTQAVRQATQQDWQFVARNERIGSDAISQGIIYRGDVVRPAGASKVLDSTNSALDNNGQPLFIDSKNRPVLAQAFRHLATEQEVVVAVNHFKSKGSDCDELGDPNAGDGQGNCNLTRTKAAQALSLWLAEEYSEQAIAVIGDLNAYAKEDPIMALAQAGYESVLDEREHTYVFFGQSGQLDHALLNNAAKIWLKDAGVWHINADEPRALDYTTRFKSGEQANLWYSDSVYRSSDHDPVIVSFELPAKKSALLSVNGSITTHNSAWVQAYYCQFCLNAEDASPWLWYPAEQYDAIQAQSWVNVGWQASQQFVGGATAYGFVDGVSITSASPSEVFITSGDQMIASPGTLNSPMLTTADVLVIDGDLTVSWGGSLPKAELIQVNGNLTWQSLMPVPARLAVNGDLVVHSNLVLRPQP